MTSVILTKDEFAKLIIEKKARNYWRSKRTYNVDGANVEKFVIESEADKFLVLFEKDFQEKHIEEENITDYFDAEDGAFQDILEKIANKIREKIANKSIELLHLFNFFFKSFVTPRHVENKSSTVENAN